MLGPTFPGRAQPVAVDELPAHVIHLLPPRGQYDTSKLVMINSEHDQYDTSKLVMINSEHDQYNKTINLCTIFHNTLHKFMNLTF